MTHYYIGVDVGTGSVRSALVSNEGHIMSTATKDIKIWTPFPNFYQQSSTEIWNAVIATVKKVMTESMVEADKVRGIGFDATCSLVVLDRNGEPLTVSIDGNQDNNIIMWMDHRAEAEADRINQTKHEVLKFVGGKISLEMQPPKLLWLKENMPDTWNNAGHFFDLPDFLTWRATDSLSRFQVGNKQNRSSCSLVCKWTYQSDGQGNDGWSGTFWNTVNLGDLANNNYEKIGNDVRPPGAPCGRGLSERAAKELGLVKGTPVGTSLIDAHAGGVGCLGCRPRNTDKELPEMTSRMALVCGTSTCHMQLSKEPLFVPGVWGPYYSSMVPGLWGCEGGQSAAGKLIDFIVENHPAYQEAKSLAQQRNQHVHEVLNTLLEDIIKMSNVSSVSLLTENIHIWPDFHGNRSPLADQYLRGMICGLTLKCDLNELAVQYLAAIQALAYGTRHILEEMKRSGHTTEVMFICGGLRKNSLYVKSHVDVTGLPMVLPDESESVLLGSSMLGASASGDYSSIQEAMESMGGQGVIVMPDDKEKEYHDKKYKVFLKMVEHQKEYRKIMDD